MSLRKHKVEQLDAVEPASSSRGAPRLATRQSLGSLKSGSDNEQGSIHSPTPRRHHALQAQLQPWLLSHSHSPLSSRAASPASVAPNSPRIHALSFSALKEARKSHAHAHTNETGGLAKRYVRWMRAAGMRDWIVPIMTLIALWVRWATGLGSYSGLDTPPMHGDYEAQRHWMELTLHLPVSKWYTYDLQYWGLDYPPLTAYVSWLCGLVGSWIDPSWFALDASRGIETPLSKVYMRATVLALDALIYIPALFTFVRVWSAHRSHASQHAALAMLLFQPALLLIDFGHFQYNSVMLGLVVHALNSFFLGRDLLGAVFFVCALCFKQMALYYSPAVFGYLLGRCFSLGWRDGTRLFVQLGITTALSFAVMFAPWLWPPSALLSGPITRIFPFGRGLFEDKVANFWCASDVVLKWRRLLPAPTLVRLSALLTALGFAPSLVLLVRAGLGAEKEERGKGGRGLALLPYALFCSATSFFLFSFQVHEKSILLPLMPLALATAGDAGIADWAVLVQNVAVFSMWPLLKRDGLGVQYIVLSALWNYLGGHNPLRVQDPLVRLLSVATYAAIALLHAVELLVDAPARYPDLFPVLNVLVSASIFALAWVWGTARLLQVSWALGALKERDAAVDGAAVKR